MKHFLLSAAALIAFSGLASAAMIQCTPVNADVVSSGALITSNVTCPTVNADPNFHLTSWSLQLNASWQDSLNPSQNHQLKFFANPGADAAGNVTCTSALGGFTGSCQATGPSVSIFLTNFSTTVTSFAQTVGGLPLPANATVTVFLNTTETRDPSGVPEPMTMSLMGAGLLAVGIAGRRFRRS